MKIEIWSDYVCPFCYIGERKLKMALKETGLEDKVELIFNSYELNSDAEKHYDQNINQLIAEKYNVSLEQAKFNNENIIRTAKSVGLDFDFENLKPTNTFDAHRLSHYAKEEGKLEEFTEVVMRSYFTDSLNISETDVLISIAEEVGLDRERVLKILKSSDFSSEVRQDENNAYNRQVSGVPYFLFDGKETVYGAQPVETFVNVLKGLNL